MTEALTRNWEKSDTWLHEYMNALRRVFNHWHLDSQFQTRDREDEHPNRHITQHYIIMLHNPTQPPSTPKLYIEAGDWAWVDKTQQHRVQEQFGDQYRKYRSCGMYLRAQFIYTHTPEGDVWTYRYILVNLEAQARYFAKCLKTQVLER